MFTSKSTHKIKTVFHFEGFTLFFKAKNLTNKSFARAVNKTLSKNLFEKTTFARRTDLKIPTVRDTGENLF